MMNIQISMRGIAKPVTHLPILRHECTRGDFHVIVLCATTRSLTPIVQITYA